MQSIKNGQIIDEPEDLVSTLKQMVLVLKELKTGLDTLAGQMKDDREQAEMSLRRRWIHSSKPAQPANQKTDERFGPPGVWDEIKAHFGAERAVVDRANRIRSLAEGYGLLLSDITDAELAEASTSFEAVLGVFSGVKHARWKKANPGSKAPSTNPFRLSRVGG